MTLHFPVDRSLIGTHHAPAQGGLPARSRVAWADLAKGWTILLVVVMHATLGVGGQMDATGWTHEIVRFAKPFRMPDFFFVAGLFAGSAAALPWRRFLDRRVLHFVYFYLLWAVILIGLRGFNEPFGETGQALVAALYQPYSSLWFIYVLPAMFLTVRLARGLPPVVMLGAALALHLAAAHHEDGGAYMLAATWSGNTALDSYALFCVFFLAGHYGRAAAFRLAERAAGNPPSALLLLGLWALANGAAIGQGWLAHPGVLLVSGLAGALAVIVVAALLSRGRGFDWLAALGRHSLVVYLGYAIPLALARAVLIRSGLIADVGLISALTALAGLIVPILAMRLVRGTGAAFLFERPHWARLAT